MDKGSDMTAPPREPLPCPFCGSNRVSANEGSTFRWVYAGCDECGAQAGEVRKQTLGTGTREEWDAAAKDVAIQEWNRRAASAPSAEPADDLERECADADRICAALGLTVEQSRTEGGSLNVPRIVAHINETLTALRESHAFGVAMADKYIASQTTPASEPQAEPPAATDDAALVERTLTGTECVAKVRDALQKSRDAAVRLWNDTGEDLLEAQGALVRILNAIAGADIPINLSPESQELVHACTQARRVLAASGEAP